MKNLATLVTMNRNYKNALSLEDFGDKTEFKSYTKAVSVLGEAILTLAQNDRNDTTEQTHIDAVYTAVRTALAFFSDDDFKVKADTKSVNALRDTAIKMKITYSEEYKSAMKKKKSFEESISIHLSDLVKNGVTIPMFSKYHDLDELIATTKDTDMLKKAIESYDTIVAEIEKIKEGEYAWYEPILDSNFRNHFEDFVSDRINDRLMHEVENREAKAKARAEKQRAKRAEAKKSK